MAQQAKRTLRPAETLRVEPVSEHLVGVTFGGPDLAGFTLDEPAQHIQVFFPDRGEEKVAVVEGEGGLVFPPERPHPTVRTYTPRRFDPATGELEVHFVVHGAGPGSDWAERARPGDLVVIGGPAGGYHVDADVPQMILGADESALPALATILEVLPPGLPVEVWVEAPAGETELPLASAAELSVTWMHRDEGERPGGRLAEVLTDPDRIGRYLADAPGTRFWAAGEAAATRRIRRYLVDEHHLDRSVAYTRAYWKFGKAEQG